MTHNQSGNSRILGNQSTGSPLALSSAPTPTQINSWDGTNSNSRGVTFGRYPIPTGVRWGGTTKALSAQGNTEGSGPFDGDFMDAATYATIGGGNSWADGVHYIGCLKNIIIFNDDLGTDKLEFATGYDG